MSTITPSGWASIVSPDADLTAVSNNAPHNNNTETNNAPKGGEDIHVRLHYLKDDPLYENTKPKQIVPEWQDVNNLSNVQLQAGPEESIHDVRGHEKDFSLDEHGFKYVHAPTPFKDWSSQPEIGRVHLPELETLLRKEVEGADEILFYDARLRQETETGVKVSGLSYKPFARQVHTDNTESSVISKIHNLLDLKADYVLQGRVRIINIWRPIKHPVYDCGLAVANGSKLKDDDVIECDRHRADTGRFWDTMGVVKYREGFEWHYMSLQDEPDVLLFKNYDSATDVPARWCLHTAFDLPKDSIPADAPTRESIEVRALVFTLPKHVRRPSTMGALQHPLAEDLQKARLPLVDEARCITDHPRTDIDEGGEVKDAVLLLRRNALKRLESVNEDLESRLRIVTTERDRLVSELEAKTKLLTLRDSEVITLHHRLGSLQGYPPNHPHLPTTPPPTSTASPPPFPPSAAIATDRESALLAHIAGLDAELSRWKAEAQGRGAEAVSGLWQASVDEGIARERAKDAVVVLEREKEVERLMGAVERLKMGR